MSSNHIFALVAFGFLAVAAGVGWHGVTAARRSETALADATARLAAKESEASQSYERLTGLKQESDTLQASLKATTVTLPRTDNRPSPPPDQAQLLAADPRLRELRAKAAHGFVFPQQYRSLYIHQRMTREQIATFERLALAREDEKLSTRDPVRVKLLNEQFQAAVERELGAEIASAVAQKEQELERVPMGFTAMLSEMNQKIPPGTPMLTVPQVAELNQILASSSASYQKGGRAILADVNWDEADARVSAVLSGSQLEAVKAVIGRQKMGLRLREFYAPAKK